MPHHRVRRPWARDPAFHVMMYPAESDVPPHGGPVMQGWLSDDDAAELAIVASEAFAAWLEAELPENPMRAPRHRPARSQPLDLYTVSTAATCPSWPQFPVVGADSDV